MNNIYVVEVDDGNEVSGMSRYVLVAENAADAEMKAARLTWTSATEEQRQGMVKDGRVTAGRLGTYEPGITGANMSRGPVIAAQRIGQR